MIKTEWETKHLDEENGLLTLYPNQKAKKRDLKLELFKTDI